MITSAESLASQRTDLDFRGQRLLKKRVREIAEKTGIFSLSLDDLERITYQVAKQFKNRINLCTDEDLAKRILGNEIPTVTHFDRDDLPQIFEAYIGNYLKNLYQSKDKVRIWIAGTSSGEEAYSYAIRIYDMLYPQILTNKLPEQRLSQTILATDINENQLVAAQTGSYPTQIIPQNLKKHFIKNQDEAQINENIRRMIRFGKMDLQKTPVKPRQKRFDFISCQNVLMHYNKKTIRNILCYIYNNLTEGGILKVGAGETEIRQFIREMKVFKEGIFLNQYSKRTRACEVSNRSSYLYKKI